MSLWSSPLSWIMNEHSPIIDLQLFLYMTVYQVKKNIKVYHSLSAPATSGAWFVLSSLYGYACLPPIWSTSWCHTAIIRHRWIRTWEALCWRLALLPSQPYMVVAYTCGYVIAWFKQQHLRVPPRCGLHRCDQVINARSPSLAIHLFLYRIMHNSLFASTTTYT